MKSISLKAETICGFKVSTKRKKVWQEELNILEKIISVCDKHKIQYSLSGGSLLGAIRHKGFIPWDDDIDIVMTRENYEKFLKYALQEFKEPYFVQHLSTEPLYDRGHIQVRNSNTTAIISSDYSNNYNKGIFVDIFPLDNVPDNEFVKKVFVRRAIYKKQWLRGPTESKAKLAYQKIFGKQRLINSYHRFVQKYNNRKTKRCGALEFRPGEFKYDNSWFDKYIEVPFMNLKVKITADYDELLTRQYGNYMEIPKNKNGSIHGHVFFDTEKSYVEYNNKIKEICEEL